jgi:hypothetical protein
MSSTGSDLKKDGDDLCAGRSKDRVNTKNRTRPAMERVIESFK